MTTTFRGKLVAKQDDFYPLYVFQNLDTEENNLFRYITVTKLPNGNIPEIELNDVGFVQCEYVNAGDTYLDRDTGAIETYKYTSCYFVNFIKEKEKIESKIYNF